MRPSPRNFLLRSIGTYAELRFGSRGRVSRHRIANHRTASSRKSKRSNSRRALIDRLSSIEPSRSDGETPDRPAIPAAIVTDMPAVEQIARKTTVEVFGFEDIKAIAAFLRKRYTRGAAYHCHSGRRRIETNGTIKSIDPLFGTPPN